MNRGPSPRPPPNRSEAACSGTTVNGGEEMSKGGKVKAIPAGYHNVTPYLIIDGAARALDFYKRVFGATEKMRMPGPVGTIGHGELTIGASVIMVADGHRE